MTMNHETMNHETFQWPRCQHGIERHRECMIADTLADAIIDYHQHIVAEHSCNDHQGYVDYLKEQTTNQILDIVKTTKG